MISNLSSKQITLVSLTSDSMQELPPGTRHIQSVWALAYLCHAAASCPPIFDSTLLCLAASYQYISERSCSVLRYIVISTQGTVLVRHLRRTSHLTCSTQLRRSEKLRVHNKPQRAGKLLSEISSRDPERKWKSISYSHVKESNRYTWE